MSHLSALSASGSSEIKTDVQVVPSDTAAAQWVVARAEAELIDRYGLLADGERGLPPIEFSAPSGAFIVARDLDNGQVIGGVGLRTRSPRVGEVKRLWVDPTARGCGVARTLMTVLESVARGLDHRTLRLDTGWRQPEAVALYGSLGWTQLTEHWDGGPVPHGWILFTKQLAP